MNSLCYETRRKILRFNFTVQDLPHEISLRKTLCSGALRIVARDLARFKRHKLARDPRVPLRRANLPRDLSRKISLAPIYSVRFLLPAEKQQICHYDHDRDGRYEAQRKVPNFKSQLAHIGAEKPAQAPRIHNKAHEYRRG